MIYLLRVLFREKRTADGRRRTGDARPCGVNRNIYYDLRLFHLRALPEDFTKRGAFYFTRPQAEFRSRKARISLPSAAGREGPGRPYGVNRNIYYDLRLFHLLALPEDFTKREAFYFTRPQAE
ncbi:MAG: hypothetical protein ILO42_00980, partial [Clostridia bacterium]|nr:hypothetical protein [Clostridia bacterium]